MIPQYVIDNCNRRSSTKDAIKAVMGKVFEYAMQNDLVKNDYSKYLEYDKDDVKIKRERFTWKEIEKIQTDANQYSNQILLLLLHTGLRANELFEILPIVRTLYSRGRKMGGETLTTNERDLKTQYKAFTEKALPELNKKYDMEHRLHDTRHTFVYQRVTN